LATPELIQFEADHLTMLKPRSWDMTDYKAVDVYALGKALREGGPAWTLVTPDEIVACGGFTLIHRGVAEAWFLGGGNMGDHILTLHRWVKRLIQSTANDAKLRRIQAHVHEKHLPGIGWALKLGFKVEAKLEQYGLDGGPVFLMAYFPNGDR